MKVLFATAEAAPYWRTGGLGEVARALPDALVARGHAVRIVLPMYPDLATDGSVLEPMGEVTVPWPGGPIRAQLFFHQPESGAGAIFVRQPNFFDTDRPYEPHPSDPIAHVRRFAFFSRAVLEIARIHDVDIVHLNDWPTGLVAAYAVQEPIRAATVFAIHNLAHQGIFPPTALPELGISRELYRTENGIEFFGNASCMKAGIALADRLVTVSPTYAREIQTPELGAGLDGLLRFRRRLLHGILNGIDFDRWDPSSDPEIAAPYDAENLDGKAVNRQALVRELKLDGRGPILVMVTRLAEQKGIDLVLDALPQLLERRARLAILGDGDSTYMEAIARAAAERPRRIAAFFRYDEPLSRRMMAGGDYLLMPSRFEPCGLGQIIAQRYGTIPVVRKTGGLADTVQDGVTGFTFEDASPEALVDAVGRAFATWRTRAGLEIRRRCMLLDRSWSSSAQRYEHLYTLALGSSASWPA